MQPIMPGDVFQILQADNLTGQLDAGQVSLDSLSSGLQWDTSELNSLGRLTIVSTAVLEPSSLVLLALSCLTGSVWRRKN